MFESLWALDDVENAIVGLHSWIRLEISDLVLSGLAGEMTIPRDFGFQILVEWVTKRERDGEVEAGGGKRENEKKNGFLF